MKSEVGAAQGDHFPSRKQSLIEDARKDKEASESAANLSLSDSEDHREGSCPWSFRFTIRHSSTYGISNNLSIFEQYAAHIYHVETRTVKRLSKNQTDSSQCFVRCEIPNASFSYLMGSLKKVAEDVKAVKEEKLPSFPRKLQDLDMCHHLVIKFEPDLDKDHPGFADQEYKNRRAYFSELAFNYRDGEPLPRIEYTPEENETWRQVYKMLVSLYPNSACKQYLDAFQQLEKHCGFREENIPQLQDVSCFLKDRTGFTLRPAAGLLSARDFLACLAFRVFPSTQYIRHPSSAMHSPEPDCCHELLGHIPMLADKEFAQFSQDIGLASLGASDADIEKLSTLYWFTIEFGLCKQTGSIKAYGAGLLSSYGELTYALSNKPELKPFDPEVAAIQPYQDNSFQPVYFVSESFEDSKAKLRQFAMKMKKSFSLHYDPFTCRVEVLDSPQKIKNTLNNIKDELDNLCSAVDNFLLNYERKDVTDRP
ncbi:LOW QUALITY PROTEIN: tyrosine 3-monooxygenase-like [Bombina bombina]|uniref:LOW QUALITY PROTEIN: tyrosine 3-monooxygenase-like n=1 Tax=Bombina bombina TaxID=8345 RepID=UPI00235A7261|nr:LOW QUALITY PROTEIN: tyrosine 3-monooxygenase-like [Bombina bombina]